MLHSSLTITEFIIGFFYRFHNHNDFRIHGIQNISSFVNDNIIVIGKRVKQHTTE